MIVRRMEEADAAAVARLAEEAFRETYPLDWRANAEALLDGSRTGAVHVAVAEVGGEVAGYANLRRWPAGGWVDQIAVSGSRRRAGIGRALLDDLVRAAVERRLWKISLIVSEENDGAIAFFEAFGMERVGPMRDEIRKGTDGVLMSYITSHDLHPLESV